MASVWVALGATWIHISIRSVNLSVGNTAWGLTELISIEKKIMSLQNPDFNAQMSFIMVALCNRADHYIFALWLLSFFLSFYLFYFLA